MLIADHGATADKALATIVSVFSIIVHMGLNKLLGLLLGHLSTLSMIPSVEKPEVYVVKVIFCLYFADVARFLLEAAVFVPQSA